MASDPPKITMIATFGVILVPNLLLFAVDEPLELLLATLLAETMDRSSSNILTKKSL